jgi:molybdopterin-containing oxidoreductase family membrane subunit
MAKILLATGLMVAYGYMMEAFMAWYSGNPYEMYVALDRIGGPYKMVYWGLIACNVLTPQLLWIRPLRTNPLGLFLISLVVSVGMWLERYMIVMSLHADFLPSSWGLYSPTIWDWATYIGTIGLFIFLLFLFLRFLPMISIFEMRTLLPEAEVHEKAHAEVAP